MSIVANLFLAACVGGVASIPAIVRHSSESSTILLYCLVWSTLSLFALRGLHRLGLHSKIQFSTVEQRDKSLLLLFFAMVAPTVILYLTLFLFSLVTLEPSWGVSELEQHSIFYLFLPLSLSPIFLFRIEPNSFLDSLFEKGVGRTVLCVGVGVLLGGVWGTGFGIWFSLVESGARGWQEAAWVGLMTGVVFGGLSTFSTRNSRLHLTQTL